MEILATIVVWQVDLAQPLPFDPSPLLLPDELLRANSIRDLQARCYWTRSRAALRTVLARCSGRRPQDVRFTYGPFGKPRLMTSRRSGSELHFSVSRSEGLCLIALSRGKSVGVDVENIHKSKVTDDAAMDEISRQFFSAREAAVLRGLQGPAKRRAFLNLWTRKEAYAKAVGTGLQLELNAMEVSADDTKAFIIDLKRDDPAAWRLIPLEPAEGFVAALAVRDGLDLPRAPVEMRTLALEAEMRRLHDDAAGTADQNKS